jgi:hypothetical protein
MAIGKCEGEKTDREKESAANVNFCGLSLGLDEKRRGNFFSAVRI